MLSPQLLSLAWKSVGQTATHPIDHTLIKALWHVHYPPSSGGLEGGVGTGFPLLQKRGDSEQFIQLRLLYLWWITAINRGGGWEAGK